MNRTTDNMMQPIGKYACKMKLGDLIVQTNEFNSNLEFGDSDVVGMTISKKIIPTKANVSNAELEKFLIVRNKHFIYNPRTHGKKIGLGFNNTEKSFIISWNNIAFKVSDDGLKHVLSDYLFIYFYRDEWDREACFRSWGTSTEVFTWQALCEMEIILPKIEKQREVVALWQSAEKLQKSHENSLADLQKIIQSYLEKIDRKIPRIPLRPYIRPVDNRNRDGKLGVNSVKGISVTKTFISTVANLNGVELSGYKIVNVGQFAYVADTSRRGDKMALAFNNDMPCIISSIYTVFEIVDETKILSEYLLLWFKRPEFDRYARFHSIGSAREVFDWEDMCEVCLPIPPIKEQQAIVNLYKAMEARRAISDQLSATMTALATTLISGVQQ